MHKKLSVDWYRAHDKTDLAPTIARYSKYLAMIGLKANTIRLHTLLVRVYLEAIGSNPTSPADAQKF